MKRIILVILIALSSLLLTTSCDNRTGGKFTFMSNNLVMKYIEPLSLEGTGSISSWHDIEQGKRIDVISLSVSIIGDEREDFEYLSKYYKDTEYPYSRDVDLFVTYISLSKPINNINVVCDRDYNSAHPAGTLLNNIVHFQGKSAYLAIQSGYKESEYPNLPNKLSTPDKFYPIYKTLSEVTRDDLTLLYPSGIKLILKRLPEVSGEYNFTVTFHMDDGKELISNINCNIQLPL